MWFIDKIEVLRREVVELISIDRNNKQTLKYIVFDINTRFEPSPDGVVIDGDIKETIYELREE